MTMHRQVLPESKLLEKLSKDIVFIKGFRQENIETWDKVSENYLPQFFYTPTYIFLDSKGDVHFEELSMEQMHRIFPEKELAKTLEKLLEKNGKGIEREKWLKIRQKLENAEQLHGSGKTDKALKELDSVIKDKATAALVERAKRRRTEIIDEKFLREELARLEKVPVPAEDTLEFEHDAVYRNAVSAALKGKIVKARDEFAYLLDAADEDDDTSRLRELHDRMNAQIRDAFGAGRIKVTRLRIEGTEDKYWEAGVTVASKLPHTDEIVVQFHVLTDGGRVFAGYQTYVKVKKGPRHQVAAYIPYTELKKTKVADGYKKYESVIDVHCTIYVSGEAVASRSLVRKPEKEWWNTTELWQLTFFHDPGWGWDSATMKPTLDYGLLFEHPDVTPVKENSDDKENK